MRIVLEFFQVPVVFNLLVCQSTISASVLSSLQSFLSTNVLPILLVMSFHPWMTLSCFLSFSILVTHRVIILSINWFALYCEHIISIDQVPSLPEDVIFLDSPQRDFLNGLFFFSFKLSPICFQIFLLPVPVHCLCLLHQVHVLNLPSAQFHLLSQRL